MRRVTQVSREKFTPVTAEGEGEGELDLDLNSTLFTGSEMLQKFTNKSVYDRRCVWPNLMSRAIHMSQHMTKEKRNKEASLNDITSVMIIGPPLK